MINKESSYKQIFKATSIFGGVQFINIIIQIIRSKAIAVLIGPSGMGIFGLITSTLALIAGMTNFGLGTSAVKEISQASASGDEEKLSKTVSVFKKLVWITGLLGFVVTLVFSPLISKLSFDNNEYTISFALVSVTLLFTQLTTAQNVLLQGLRKLNSLAKANIYAAVVSLVLTLPLYYFFKIDGIVPAIIIGAVITFIMEFSFASKIKLNKSIITFKEALKQGQGMLTLGFMLSLSSLITLGVSYIIRVYITKAGSLSDLGLYNAGFAIINNYVGLIFTAMATDYYPRLASVSGKKAETNLLVNQQSEIAILILAPLLCVFLVFIKIVIVLLYSKSFLPIEAMIHWAILGIFFKTIGWALGFVLLTNGSAKLFFWNEFIANIYILILSVLGYHFYGLTGLGISFLAGYFFYFIQIFCLSNKKFNFSFKRSFLKIFFFQFFIAVGCFVCVKILTGWVFYSIGILMIIISLTFSIFEINKLINLKEVFKRLKKQ